MRTTIDQAGRIVIPRALRDAVGLTAGEVRVSIVGSAVQIEAMAPDALIQVGELLMIDDEGGAPITVDDVRASRRVGQR